MNILNNSFSSQNNSSLIDYLLKKLESRIKNVSSSRSAIHNICDFQDLIENKKQILKHFLDIEDDFKQGVQAIKALVAQNKDLSDQVILLQKRMNNYEAKSISDFKVMNELNDRNNELKQELMECKQNLNDLQGSYNYVQDRNCYLESEVTIKEKEIEEFTVLNNNFQERIEKLSDENNLMKMQITNFNEYSYKPADENKDESEKSEEYKNVKNIINEREQAKKLINESVKNYIYSDDNEDKYREKDKVDNSGDNKNKEEFNIDKNANENIPNFNTKKKSNVNNTNSTKKNAGISNKAELLSQLVLKALESTESIDYLNEKFGGDFMQKMLSLEVTDDFLLEVEEAINKKSSVNVNVNESKKKTSTKNNSYNIRPKSTEINSSNSSTKISPNFDISHFKNNKQNNQLAFEYKFDEDSSRIEKANVIVEEKEENEEPEKKNGEVQEDKLNNSHQVQSKSNMSFISSSSRNKLRNTKSNSLVRSHSTSYIPDIAQGNTFEKSLRDYTPLSPYYKNNFNNYTNPYSRYFDDDLQKGGLSKLEKGKNKKLK